MEKIGEKPDTPLCGRTFHSQLVIESINVAPPSPKTWLGGNVTQYKIVGANEY